MRVASVLHPLVSLHARALPQRIPCGLHRNRAALHPCGFHFASAHPMRVASWHGIQRWLWPSTLPQRIPCGLHPSGFVRYTPSQHFASAHPMRVASGGAIEHLIEHNALPQRIPCGLHRATPRTSREASGPLPQRIPCGLHPGTSITTSSWICFASAHPMRVASAKMHKIYSMDL